MASASKKQERQAHLRERRELARGRRRVELKKVHFLGRHKRAQQHRLGQVRANRLDKRERARRASAPQRRVPRV
jgi:hypothetical protein